jgi:TatA/E family protein of Tat protein translocase
MFSIPHMIVIFVVVLVVFGPQKLPELARGLGKLMAEFRKASADFRSAFEQEMRDIERQAMQAERKKQAEAAAKAAAEIEQPVTQGNAEGAQAAGIEAAAGTRLTEGSAGLEPVLAPVPEAIPRSSDGDEASGTVASANDKPENAAGETRAVNDGGNLPPGESVTDAESLAHDIHRPA